MSDSIDRVFVRAISTIKALSARKGPGSLPQPPVDSRIKLYGLYKQATGMQSLINTYSPLHIPKAL